ncbi:sporulation integral membrane protein YlbJ [Syntrophobotulus glycolicus DSM 8271]|uniref:Sporulation integral membrane protein YlbJ n=1 Tax=Syntrophobotulus glycolicus (strain DSM 8271 / FlGlyR) TaxID=645991 RepID=F0SUF6_SYNGF|nr:nucleoside recognition domain-containing protein [Syntrophobotulus glycolicus]ADY56606.1 sporulation integral membrane protein YlbJ [Syntrophobotulus glycolicus DSM 8271]
MKSIFKILPFLFFAFAMFYYPQEVFFSAITGLKIWANIVLPALFPFFVLSDLLMKQGFVSFIGVLFEPLMRPLFRLPGKASFVLAMTHISGIPIGAVLTCRMRQENDLTRLEAERLLAITCNPSPGFMLGVVAAGMLKDPGLGVMISASVYLANIMVGLIFRFYGHREKKVRQRLSWQSALSELRAAQQKNKKAFGELLADAIKNSTNTVLLVGGYITFFSVMIHLLTITQFHYYFAHIVGSLSGGLLKESADALIQGLFETTLGCQTAALSIPAIKLKIALITLFMGWGGLSVFGQVASFTATTDLRFLPFVIARTLHAFFAMLLSQIFLIFSPYPASSILSAVNLSHSWPTVLHWSFISLWYSTIIMAFILLIIFLVKGYFLIVYRKHRL